MGRERIRENSSRKVANSHSSVFFAPNNANARGSPRGVDGGSIRIPSSIIAAIISVLVASLPHCYNVAVEGRQNFVPSRDRVVKYRQEKGQQKQYRDNGKSIEGPNYHHNQITTSSSSNANSYILPAKKKNEKNLRMGGTNDNDISFLLPAAAATRRTGQLTSCCSAYSSYSASDMCSLYGQDCQSGKTKSHDDEDQSCTQEGLAFIGVSFSVNTKYGNPYSYQLCDQFPMGNIIDRDYKYAMSMDEDGWLVGGGYKQFDYSGKMPYIDSSHTELLRIGSMDVSKGGTSIQQVYSAMESISFDPFPFYPEYLKGGGGKKNNNNYNSGSAPSSDITLIVSVVEEYSDDSYSTYQKFLNSLFTAMKNVDGGACMDDHDTDPHVSMARGVKFKSSYHKQQYMYAANLEVAVWQAMYPKGVVIGSKSYASFPPGVKGSKKTVGYGNIYFFFDRNNITKAFPPSSSLTDQQFYYSTLFSKGKASSFYSSVTSYSSNNNQEDNGDSWEYNPYQWKTNMAIHDQTNGWDLPPNCNEEGETFVGIPLSRQSASNLQSTNTFQEQFDFEYLLDRNFTYIKSFGTNHGWLVGGEQEGNSAGSIVDIDTAHIPLFNLGTTNPNMGGLSLSDMIKVLKTVQFGTLYIKPAFVFADSNGHLKLQFEADASSALGYLYDNLCQMLGIKWNYISPSNSYGLYTNCAMHAAGDRASYGCGPANANSGGFCPQMTLAYSPRFKSQDMAAEYITNANNYVDYWRALYPYGVAVGTNKFCDTMTSSGYSGGCLGLFLNRMDLYYVFAPDLSGAWVQFHSNGDSIAPSSIAPTYEGGCDNPRNHYLDKCYKLQYKKYKKSSTISNFWSSLGNVGKLSFVTLSFMMAVMIVAIMFVRVRKQKRKGEKDMLRRLKRRKRRDKGTKEPILPDSDIPLGVEQQNYSRMSGLTRNKSMEDGWKSGAVSGALKSAKSYDAPILQPNRSTGNDADLGARSFPLEESNTSRKSKRRSSRRQSPPQRNSSLNRLADGFDPTDNPNFFLT